MPRVSVIIPTFRRPDFLPCAMTSVLNQTFRDFEVIIVDDASNDTTGEVVRNFKDERIRYICQEANKGGAAARNTGIQNSHGKYIAFLDDDDEWLPEKLKLQVALLDKSPQEVGGIYTGYEKIKRSTGEVESIRIPTNRGDLSQELLFRNLLGSTSTILLRKECFEKVGLFDEKLPSFQDYDLWIRISKEFQFDFINQVLFRYYTHGHKIWSNTQALNKGLDFLRNKHCTNAFGVRKGFSAHYLSLGVMYCYEGNLEKGRKAYLSAIRLYPFQIRNYFYLFLSLLGMNNFKKFKALRQRYFL